MSKIIKPGMLCFLANLKPGDIGYKHMGKVVTIVGVSVKHAPHWDISPHFEDVKSNGQKCTITAAPTQYLSPIDGGPLGEDVYTTKHIPALDKRQPARV